MSTSDALAHADRLGLDLVELNDDGVCRLIDYKKELYKKKKTKQTKVKQKSNKEVRMRPVIGDADYLVKMKSVERLIDNGHKVKVSIVMKGRENAFVAKWMLLAERVVSDARDIGISVESGPNIEGNRIVILLS